MTAETLPIEIIMRVEVQGHKAVYLYSNIEGLKALKSPKEPDPEFAQKYLDKVGEDTLMVILRDFGEYQNWGGEWKPASNIFKPLEV